jgi:formate dehydrogenase (coenzyme F420) beta subunit
MVVARVLTVEEAKPEAAIREFLAGLLESHAVDGLVVPGAGEGGAAFTIARDRASLRDYDPLTPRMHTNAAHDLPQALAQGQARLAAVLHPCETRTVVEMAKRGLIDRARLVILATDCGFAQAGPAPDDPQALDLVRRQALACASAGQAAPKEARLACRLCERPAADIESADVLLGWIGLDPDERLLLIADEESDERLGLAQLAQRSATEREAVDREMALWRMADRRKKAAGELLEEIGLSDGHPAVVAGYLSRCTLCGDCVEACMLASDDLRAALKQGKTVFVQALLTEAQRLASCSGCGFCQVSCPVDIPLCAIAYAVGHQVQSRMHYTPGRSVEDPLPWAS